MRKLKAFSPVVLIALLAGAFGVPPASAAVFHSESEKTTYTGSAEEATVIEAGGAELSCPKATFEATESSETSGELTVFANFNPAGKKCVYLWFNTEVNMNGCQFSYVFNGEFDILGPACHGVTFTAAGCTITIPEQIGLTGLTYTNKGAGQTRELTVDTNPIQGISGTAAGTCMKNGPFANGVYSNGAAIFTGEVDGTVTHTGVWWE